MMYLIIFKWLVKQHLVEISSAINVTALDQLEISGWLNNKSAKCATKQNPDSKKEDSIEVHPPSWSWRWE